MAGLSSSNAPFDQIGFDMHTRDLERLWLLYSDISAGTASTTVTQTVSLGDDLEAIKALSGAGYLYKIQAGAWELRASIPWADISGAPTTYPWASITGTPTTLAGYGITDAVPNTRTVSTTSPLTGGGALSGDLTLALSTVPATLGGTGQTTYAVGDLLYASTTSALSRLADVATGNALISGGVGVAPSWGKIGLTTHISGTLAIANGGTNATTAAAGTVPNATSGTAASWSATPTLGVAGTTAGSMTYESSNATAGNRMRVVVAGGEMSIYYGGTTTASLVMRLQEADFAAFAASIAGTTNCIQARVISECDSTGAAKSRVYLCSAQY